MPSPFAKTLIDIAVGHLLPTKYSWVSEVEAGPYHVETGASAANGGNTFRALCGASGEFFFHFTARQIIARLKCQVCQQLSTTGILDVADQATGNAPVIDGLQVGDEGVDGCPELGDRIGSRPRGATGLEKPPHQVQILTADSQKSFIEKMVPLERNPGQCVCGNLAKHTCPCGEKVCQAHFYDGEGQHVEGGPGFCSACVSLIQAENSSRYPDPALDPHFA